LNLFLFNTLCKKRYILNEEISTDRLSGYMAKTSISFSNTTLKKTECSGASFCATTFLSREIEKPRLAKMKTAPSFRLGAVYRPGGDRRTGGANIGEPQDGGRADGVLRQDGAYAWPHQDRVRQGLPSELTPQ
jgi:hypothetical protein